MLSRWLSLCTAVAVVILAAAAARGQSVLGTIQQQTFTGPITGKQIQFSIYLPPGYSTHSGRYPVVYHLHGLGGSHTGPQTTQVAAEFEAAHQADLIGPVIIVFPNGYTNAFWADSIDGAKPAETNVVAELVPHVDTNYRTLIDRRCRVVQGFSMGGFGAAKFQSKFPQMFVSGVIYDGAMLTWNNMVQFQPQIAAEIFGNQQAYFDQYSPWYWSSANAATLIDDAAFRSVVGALVPANQNYRNHLQALGIPLQYVETGCDHVLPCLLDAQGPQTIAFIAGRLGSGVPGDLNCDDAVNQADLALLLANYGCASFCPSDADGDGDTDQGDLAVVLANYLAVP